MKRSNAYREKEDKYKINIFVNSRLSIDIFRKDIEDYVVAAFPSTRHIITITPITVPRDELKMFMAEVMCYERNMSSMLTFNLSHAYDVPQRMARVLTDWLLRELNLFSGKKILIANSFTPQSISVIDNGMLFHHINAKCSKRYQALLEDEEMTSIC